MCIQVLPLTFYRFRNGIKKRTSIVTRLQLIISSIKPIYKSRFFTLFFHSNKPTIKSRYSPLFFHSNKLIAYKFCLIISIIIRVRFIFHC